jgi:hypothetical protein
MSKVFSDDWMNEQGFLTASTKKKLKKIEFTDLLYFLDFIDINYFLFNR